MMTELEAWKYLADMWGNEKNIIPNNSFEKKEVAVVFDSQFSPIARGLCTSVEILYDTGKISGPTFDTMAKRLIIHSPNPKSAYWWPCTIEGAKCRAEYCRRMALICEKEIANGL